MAWHKMRTFWMLLAAASCLLSQAGTSSPGARKESPHFNAGRCGDCHGKALPQRAGSTGSLRKNYLDLCNDCHPAIPVACTFHVHKLTGRDMGGLVPDLFPLDQGKLDCLSCHDARLQCRAGPETGSDPNDLFLRGSPRGSAVRFCFACHLPERYKAEEDRGER